MANLLIVAKSFEATFKKAFDKDTEINGADAVDSICFFMPQFRKAIKSQTAIQRKIKKALNLARGIDAVGMTDLRDLLRDIISDLDAV